MRKIRSRAPGSHFVNLVSTASCAALTLSGALALGCATSPAQVQSGDSADRSCVDPGVAARLQSEPVDHSQSRPASEAGAPGGGELADGALDAMLSGYEYPYPVQRFLTQSQGHEISMAYMVVEPKMSAGAAPLGTVTLLHGKNFSGAYWKSTADRLAAAGYRVVIPDQLGFGKSTKLVGFQYSFQELARLTHALLEELAITESIIVGHSMGGMLGTRFALMYPKQTSKLVLVNPIGLEDWKRVVPYRSVDEWEAANLESTPDGVQKYMKESYFDGKWKDDYEELVTIQAGWARGPDRELMAKVSAAHYHMIFTQPVVYEFSDVRVPTLLVIGQRDTTAIGKGWVSSEVAKSLGRYPELGRAAQATIPQAKLVELDDIGHVPQVESFDAWIAALLAFLK